VVRGRGKGEGGVCCANVEGGGERAVLTKETGGGGVMCQGEVCSGGNRSGR
jgi:hypothetical protein